MEHGGQEMDSAYSLSPILYQLILPTLMETPSSSMQIPVSSDLSNETLTIVTESLNQMEGLTLQKGTLWMSPLIMSWFMLRFRLLQRNHRAPG
jgi:hypothetical protein